MFRQPRGTPYKATSRVQTFHAVRASAAGQLQVLLIRIVWRIMRLLTRNGYLVEEQGMTYLGDTDPEAALAPLQAAACTYRIALGPGAGQKVLTLRTVPSQRRRLPPSAVSASRALACMPRCGSPSISVTNSNTCAATLPALPLPMNGLHATVPVRSCCNSKALDLDGTTHIVMSPLEFMQRLAALVPRPRLHLFASMACSHPTPSYVRPLSRARRPTRLTTHQATVRHPIPRRRCAGA